MFDDISASRRILNKISDFDGDCRVTTVDYFVHAYDDVPFTTLCVDLNEVGIEIS